MAAAGAVLITGAHGFLGRHVARALGAAGWQVAGLGHGSWQEPEWRRWGISRWQACDITLGNLRRHAGEVDAVVHCAGAGDVAFSGAHPLESFAKTVGTTADVLEHLRVHLPRAALVLVSSAAVYGDASGRPISENDALAPISPYGVHKQMAEELCACYARIYALRVRVLRFFSIYGPGLRKQLLWDACNKLRDGVLTFAGTGAEMRDWLHVADAVALVAAVLHAETQPYRVLNGGTGTGASVSQVLEELCAALGVRGRPAFTGERRSGNPESLIADSTQARALGWRPAYDWRAGVREYAGWFRSLA